MASMQNAAAKRGNHRLPRNPGMSSYSNLVFHSLYPLLCPYCLHPNLNSKKGIFQLALDVS